MNSYDFSRLNDKDFEDLIIDLLKAETPGISIERFMPGRDGGMDGRFYIGTNNIIIQSKHYINSSYSSLITNLKKEALKISNINPSRYILAICHGLTNTRKSEIIDIFGSQYLRSDDILSIDDITHRLSEHNNIERKYYKLWLNSTSMLTSILHNDIIGRSNHILDQIKRNADKYVETRDFNIAINKIETVNTLIITGEPGVGKTTLAEQLCLHYVLNGYELVYIENDIEEGEKVIVAENKQLFLYDDFLGRNYLDALRNKEDSKIVRFINRIRRSEEKKLILTSRTTILNQGKSSSELFYINNTHKDEYEVELKNLNLLDKAKVLYNHIWFSELPNEYKNCIWEDKKYRKIISHKNYNPRLISFITDFDKISHLNPDNYWEYIVDSLNNPSAIWDYMLTKQIPKCVYYLTFLVSLNNGKITEKNLQQCYNNFLEIINFDRSRNDYLNFKDCSLHAVKSTLQRKLEEGKEPIYDVLNPSISDYLIEKINDNVSSIPAYFSALTTMQSLYNLNTLLNKSIPLEIASKIIDAVLNSIDKYKSEDYTIEFIRIILTSNKVAHADKFKTARTFNSNYLTIERFYAGHNYKVSFIVNWIALNDTKWLGHDKIMDYVESSLLINSEVLDYEDLNILAQVSNFLGANIVTENIRNLLLEYWQNFAHEYISESNEFNDFYSEDDVDILFAKAKDCIADLLSDSTLVFHDDEIETIMDNLYPLDIIERNINNSPDWGDDEGDDRGGIWNNGYDAVDDLFSRE